MIRVFQIVVLSCLVLCLPGCEPAEKEKPIWEEVKIGDIAPFHSGKRPGGRLLKIVNFDVHIFEIPAENISKLNEIRRMLYTMPLRFKNINSFQANLFSVRSGQIQMWDKIQDLLVSAGGQKIVKVSLLLSDGQANDFVVTGLDNVRNIFYISTEGTMEGATIGPGVLVLRAKAGKIPGSRGVCNVEVEPVFSSPIRSPIPQLTTRAKSREFAFACCRFGLKMSPGDFFLLGPERYISNQVTLGGLLFSKPEGSLFFSETEGKGPERKAAIRIFLLACTRVDY